MEDIGVNYMTKEAHRAATSPSLYSSLTNDPEIVGVFLEWIKYRG